MSSHDHTLFSRALAIASLILVAFTLLACTPIEAAPVVLEPQAGLASPAAEATGAAPAGPELQVTQSNLEPPVMGASPEPLVTQAVSIPLVIKPPATPLPGGTETPFQPLPSVTPTPEIVRFGVIGDYGWAGQAEADVAALVKSWDPDFVITVGDNNYPSGSPDTLDENIGQFYGDFIYPYTGEYGDGADINRFFPTIGNHDLDTDGGQGYLEYFTLPGNERYYDFTWGPLHLFALNSDSREQDGVGSSSVQAGWLEERLASSTLPWQIVYMHHPPYSSGTHGAVTWTRWPYREWGADVVLSGHDHHYERLLIDGFPYFINGVGGGPIYPVKDPVEGSQALYNEDYGAMLVEATEDRLVFQFITRDGEVIDRYELQAP